MDVNYESCKITLDWDRLTYKHAVNAAKKMFRDDKRIESLELRLSPTNGFHLLLIFKKPVKVAWERRRYSDDGRRLVHDLLNPAPVHDILWNKKVVAGVPWYSQTIMRLERARQPRKERS